MSPRNSKWIAVVMFVAVLCVGCMVNASAELTIQLVRPEMDWSAEVLSVTTNTATTYEAVAYLDGVELEDGDVQWQWDFGDGTDPVTGDPVVHTYSADGLYCATVTATFGGVDASYDFGVYSGTPVPGLSVELAQPGVDPNLDPATVGPNPISLVTGGETIFDASAYLDGAYLDPSQVQWQWDFGDGSSPDTTSFTMHTYRADGTYNGTVTATYGEIQTTVAFTVVAGASSGSLTVRLTQPDMNPNLDPAIVGPNPVSVTTHGKAAFDAVACVGGVQLEDGFVQWEWDFGDGTAGVTDNPTTHTYAADGTYNATVTATYGEVQTALSFTVVAVAGVGQLDLELVQPEIDPNLDPDIVGPNPVSVSTNVATTFEVAASLGDVPLDEGDVRWEWDFGDGSGSNVADPTAHTYWADGMYNASVTATYGGVQTTLQFTVVASSGDAPEQQGSRARVISRAVQQDANTATLVFPDALGDRVAEFAPMKVLIDCVHVAEVDWRLSTETSCHYWNYETNQGSDGQTLPPWFIGNWTLDPQDRRPCNTWNTFSAHNTDRCQWQVKVLTGFTGEPGNMQPQYAWTNVVEVQPYNTVVHAPVTGTGTDSGPAPVIFHHAGDWWHEIDWSIDHLDRDDPQFDVTVTIYRLTGASPISGFPVAVLSKTASIGSDGVVWDGTWSLPGFFYPNGMDAGEGVYVYSIHAAHTGMCYDNDKSSVLTASVKSGQTSQFYRVGLSDWNKTKDKAKLTVRARYELSRDASDCTIRFFGSDFTKLGELAHQPSTGGVPHWSSPETFNDLVSVDADGNPTTPIYCVIYATECAADAAWNRDALPKPALQAGTASLVPLIRLHANSRYGAGMLSREVPPASQQNPGAYVHWNIDDDSRKHMGTYEVYDPTASGDWTLEDAMSNDDDDLAPLQITLNAPDDDLGEVQLGCDSGKLKIWKSVRKGSTNVVLRGGGAPMAWHFSVTAEDPLTHQVTYPQRASFESIRNGMWVEGCHKGAAELVVYYCSQGHDPLGWDVVDYKFIAATKGSQAGTKTVSSYTSDRRWPKLVGCEWSVLDGGPDLTKYNCIAYSVGDETEKIFQREVAGYAPNGLHSGYPSEDAVIAFYEAYGHAFAGRNSPGAKIMYYDKFHAAKLLDDPDLLPLIAYSSKMGWSAHSPLIEHVMDQLDGQDYGDRTLYFR